MTQTPLEYLDSLRIGTIEHVSAGEIKVLLDIEAPEGVALNTGAPRQFPRVNGYVLIPCDGGFLTAQIEWITIERSQYPKRKGMRDFGLVDLPYPLRKMGLSPLGLLTCDEQIDHGNVIYRFRRGVETYPTVGDAVLLPARDQLKAIVESGENHHVLIGTSLLADNAEVKVDPDRLFGRHLAILGNTGSGKSCSVAGVIRWSLEAARRSVDGSDPNARFIILDPNGEYAHAFCDIDKVRVYSVDPDQTAKQLQIPIWLWNCSEWSAFAQASTKTQQPTLIHALRAVRDGTFNSNIVPSTKMRRYLQTLISILQLELKSGNPWGRFPLNKNFFEKIKVWRTGLEIQDVFSDLEKEALNGVMQKLDELINNRSGQYPIYDFSLKDMNELLSLMQSAHTAFGGSHTDILPIDANIPLPFTDEDLLRSLEAISELLGVSDYVETMQIRIRTLLSDSRIKMISGTNESLSLDEWLCNYIGNNMASNGSITVIDLSLVPSDVVYIIAAVVSRITLEALQRYRRLHKGRVLPTVLVMEEAHAFIKRYKNDAENQGSAAICCQVFEKIAREGRKFGLGLVLSSQRPSELSPTVLSQCNSFLLHRISNEQDQELVKKLLPDNLRGFLRDLPSLPAQHAILLGWAYELPVLVHMNSLPESQRPRSDDPDFWAVWTCKNSSDGQQETRDVDWKLIANDWQQRDIT